MRYRRKVNGGGGKRSSSSSWEDPRRLALREILQAIARLGEKSGSSAPAIRSFLSRQSSRSPDLRLVKEALARAVARGKITQKDNKFRINFSYFNDLVKKAALSRRRRRRRRRPRRRRRRRRRRRPRRRRRTRRGRRRRSRRGRRRRPRRYRRRRRRRAKRGKKKEKAEKAAAEGTEGGETTKTSPWFWNRS